MPTKNFKPKDLETVLLRVVATSMSCQEKSLPLPKFALPSGYFQTLLLCGRWRETIPHLQKFVDDGQSLFNEEKKKNEVPA